jgi:hypothetical protein
MKIGDPCRQLVKVIRLLAAHQVEDDGIGHVAGQQGGKPECRRLMPPSLAILIIFSIGDIFMAAMTLRRQIIIYAYIIRPPLCCNVHISRYRCNLLS